MGLFGNPKCPRCGGKTVKTNYSFPYPSYRCNRCVKESGHRKKEAKRVAELEERVRELENKNKTK